MRDTLVDLGLTDNEAKTYIAVLELGASFAGKIAQKTGIHRRNIYDLLERLVEKGFVSYITENETNRYQAVDPKNLLDMADQRRKQLEEAMPKLSLLFSMAKGREETTFYKGKQGLKYIFESQLESREVLVLGAAKDAREILQYFLSHYTKKRAERKVKLKLIYYGRKADTQIPNSEIRYLPEEHATNCSVNIWGSKVAIIQWKETPNAILMNSKDIAQTFRNQFEMLWNVAKP